MISQVMLRFDKYHHQTEKAYLVQIGNQEHWIPKKLCRRFITNKKLGGNVTIPAWLYQKITGVEAENIPMEDATFIIEKHIPIKIETINTIVNATLLK